MASAGVCRGTPLTRGELMACNGHARERPKAWPHKDGLMQPWPGLACCRWEGWHGLIACGLGLSWSNWVEILSQKEWALSPIDKNMKSKETTNKNKNNTIK